MKLVIPIFPGERGAFRVPAGATIDGYSLATIDPETGQWFIPLTVTFPKPPTVSFSAGPKPPQD